MAVQKVKLKIGTVYQKEEGGIYYFRYQINGARKAISLKTRNKQEAVREAEKITPLLQATSSEVIAAHVQYARHLTAPEKNLLLSQAWDVYEKSPDRDARFVFHFMGEEREIMPQTEERRRALLEKANTLPLCPGVYIMRDTTKKVIYEHSWK